MGRLRAWIVVAPLVAAGTLVSHAVAYRATGTPVGSLHGYLEHAPQVVLLVSLLAIALAGLGARLRAPRAWSFALLAPLAFLAQEHLELLLHTGDAHSVITSPTLLVGLVLQVPLGLGAWLVATRLLRALQPVRSQAARLGHAISEVVTPAPAIARPALARASSARAPPSLRRP